MEREDGMGERGRLKYNRKQGREHDAFVGGLQ
jgi:hypothetical protein